MSEYLLYSLKITCLYENECTISLSSVCYLYCAHTTYMYMYIENRGCVLILIEYSVLCKKYRIKALFLKYAKFSYNDIQIYLPNIRNSNLHSYIYIKNKEFESRFVVL